MPDTQTLPATTELPKPPKAKRATPAAIRPANPNNLATAILAITGELEPINKRGHNDWGKFTYAKMPDVLRELAPRMAKHGILVTQDETDWGTNAEGVLRIKFAFDILHAPTGEVLTLHRTGTLKISGSSKGGYNDKGSAAIATMVRKYLLIELFGCVVDDLPDADSEGEREIKPAPPAADVMQKPEEPKPDPKLEKEIQDWDSRLALSYPHALPGKAADALRAMFKTVPRHLWDYLLPQINDKHLPAATELDARHARDLQEFR